jgi:hypothetical protein
VARESDLHLTFDIDRSPEKLRGFLKASKPKIQIADDDGQFRDIVSSGRYRNL